ncbi:MAG: hypothetical protein ACREVQ_14985 [Burkholderiales bacterium]
MRALAAAVLASLLAACAGPSQLQVIDNVLSHEGPPPPSPAIVRQLLARPLDARAAAPIFDSAVPASLREMAARVRPVPGPRIPLDALIEPYLRELAAARAALPPAPPNADTREFPPPLDAQRVIVAGVDAAAMQRAAELFIEANARLLRKLREAGGRIDFPAAGARYEVEGVTIIVGTPGDDEHKLEPLRDGRVRVILDPGGNDRYRGSDVVAYGLAAILDLAGNDRYESDGAAWGVAIAGVSLLVDLEGDDVYEAQDFAEGAALAGLGALLDLAGNDTYRVRAFGQGLGLAGGVGLLWDVAGNDRYVAEGLPDPFARGGGLSFAQGVAVGVRTGVGGGIGILRDDAGDDSYQAQLYAQGAAYYYSLGLLWDRAGNDRYRAARYAQGAGVHQAVGILRDESGDDTYELTVGVGQGMGLDLAVGVLYDGAGNDRYTAPTLAQGAATDNGAGIVEDEGGANQWRLDALPGRGKAAGSRGLPSTALVLADAPPLPGSVPEESDALAACPPEPAAQPVANVPLEQAMRSLGPELLSGRIDAPRYALVLRKLRERPVAALAELPAQDFDVLWPLAAAMRCALEGADDATAVRMWDSFEQRLGGSTPTHYAGVIAGALRARPAPPAQMRRLIDRLAANPSCGIRTAALALDGTAGAAQSALRSDCWELQAKALRMLASLGVAPADASRVPPFLRQAVQASGKRSESSRSP